jgi:hypothetical protein
MVGTITFYHHHEVREKGVIGSRFLVPIYLLQDVANAGGDFLDQ